MCVVLSPMSLKELLFCVALLLLCICSSNPLASFSGVGVSCWMLFSASRAPGVFGGQALQWSDFLVVVSSTSCCCSVYAVQGQSKLKSLLVQWASICVCHSTFSSCPAAYPLETEVSRCRMLQFAKCFLPAQTHMWNELPYTVFDTGMLDRFKGAVNFWLLPWVCFLVFPWCRCLWGCISNL